MPQNIKEETEVENVEKLEKLVAPQASPCKYELMYYNIASALYVHLAALYGLYIIGSAKWCSILFIWLYGNAGMFGVLGGAHRLWSHKSYKAKLPLQIILMLCFSTFFGMSIIWWVQNHRRHHKFSDTDGDPHNSTRGFFFSHIGWFLVRRHPEAAKRRKCVDISDLLNDPVVMFQKKYSAIIIILMSLFLPVTVMMMCFGESFSLSWHLNMLRVALLWNGTFMINSFAHLWGNKPYDKTNQATQNHLVSFFSLGEGFHNYHHTFPWDYRAGELGNNWLNVSSLLIDFFALIGWAYDLKTAPAEVIEIRKKRTGDGTDSWGFNTGFKSLNRPDDELIR